MRTAGIFTLVCLASVLFWGGNRAIHYIQYDRHIKGFLKQAADANTSELAEKKLLQAMKMMDAMGLCNGSNEETAEYPLDHAPTTYSEDCYTSVLWRTPDEDVGFWRTNIQATYDDVHTMTPEDRADNLTESNQLMKVRETLLDHGNNGDLVTAPEGISVYPHNTLFFWWGFLSTLFTIGGAVRWWEIETRH